MDLDVLVVRSFDELLQYETTIGLEAPVRICDGVIVAAKGAAFLRLWLNAYVDDNIPEKWAYNSGAVRFITHNGQVKLTHWGRATQICAMK